MKAKGRDQNRDFTPHQKKTGGSKKGSTKLKWLSLERDWIYLWGRDEIAGGDENIFVHHTKARWSHKAFRTDDCIKMLLELSPTLRKRLDAKKVSPESLRGRVKDRHHKMYYDNKKHTRMFSSEHPNYHKEYGAALPEAERLFRKWRRRKMN